MQTYVNSLLMNASMSCAALGRSCLDRYEADLAILATHKLRDLLSDIEWRLARIGIDPYGRTLATFHTVTSTIGDELIAAGLARKWRGRRMPWC